MKIAVIGSGAAGMMAAWGLNGEHDVTVYEKEAYVGGHVFSQTTDCFDNNFVVDNGFIVFNFETYPLLTALLKHFDLKPARAKMSVSISGGNAFTLCEDLTQVLISNKAWLFDPRVFLLLVNIVRFNIIAKRDLKNNKIPDVTILEYLKKRWFARRFFDNFLGPIASAIWIGPPASIANVPARSFIKFFEHHNMLGFRKFKWFTVKGGATQYINALAAELKNPPKVNCSAIRVTRGNNNVTVEDATGNKNTFDQIVFACQPKIALKLLAKPSAEETKWLSTFNFENSISYCHRDTTLMPERKGTWMSWNCHYRKNPDTGDQKLTISYYYNSLLKMDRTNPVFLSIDPPFAPNPELTIKKYDWAHIQFDRTSITAQKNISQLQGQNNTWYAGAWMGYGFHEDALGSGLDVARALGCTHSDLPQWRQPDW